MPTTLTVVNHRVKEQGVTVLDVTGTDGIEYEVKLALLIPLVFDTGQRNPIDGLPIFNVQANTAVQVTRKTNA
ncbi:MAG TPA: hypothetical protein VEK07_00195 [Polyangiaceae bacterium]|nr:hypothetical protein [Polyangiaceae bacterium]